MENIQLIDTKRINGWLDIGSYFTKRLGRKYIDLEDLENNGIIESEPLGKSEKFWILSCEGERIALYKEQMNIDGYESYAELISEEVSKILGIPTAHYDLATFQNMKGVISYNFLKGYDYYLEGTDIISEFYLEKLLDKKDRSSLYGIDDDKDSLEEAFDKLNNLEDIWFILENKFKDHPNKEEIVKDIVNSLVGKLVFDVLMVNVDDHTSNWGTIEDINENTTLAPQFDNARIINLHRNILVERFVTDETIEDKELRFNIDGSNIRKPLDVLRQFLNISSSEYISLVRDKVNLLREHINDVPYIIEARTNAPMPDVLKKYFTTTMDEHLTKVEEIVNDKKYAK